MIRIEPYMRFEGAMRTVAACAMIAAALIGCRNPQPAAEVEATECGRIVSLAPNITEMLFALGLGQRIVGVTRYCDYPKEALAKTKVGGYTDPSFETMVNLKPDLVMITEYHQVIADRLAGLNLKTLPLKTESLRDVVGSIRQIGRVCGVEKASEALTETIENKLARIQNKVRGRARPRALISVGRTMGSSSLKEVFIAGTGTFFDEAVEAAGGVNAYRGKAAEYPRISAEGIMELDPDVIVDLVEDLKKKGIDEEDVKDEWLALGHLSAVKNGRVHVIGEDYVVVPGPRVVLLVERLAKLFHPEADWN